MKIGYARRVSSSHDILCRIDHVLSLLSKLNARIQLRAVRGEAMVIVQIMDPR